MKRAPGSVREIFWSGVASIWTSSFFKRCISFLSVAILFFRRAVLAVRASDVSCRVLQASKFSYHYNSRKDGQAVLRTRIREITETRVRYGYRRIHVSATGGLADLSQADLQALLRGGSPVTQQDA